MTPSNPTRPAAGLTIGDVARLAGITPRAIRHYHSTGVLPEPERDASGYRRYDADAVVDVVRVVRLRAVGMPIAQIAQAIGAAEATAGPLVALAAGLDTEIERLTALRDQIHELIRSGAHERPATMLLHTLQQHDRVAAEVALDPTEASAAELADALHPQGMAGLLDQAHDLVSDPDVGQRISPLLQRFRALEPATPETELDRLAADVAEAFPRPAGAPRPVDVDLMERLLGPRLTPVQRQFLRRLRARMDAAAGDGEPATGGEPAMGGER